MVTKQKNRRKHALLGAVSGVFMIFLAIIFLLNTHNSRISKTDIITIEEPIAQALETPLPELPFGGRVLIPDYRFLALYGSPSYSSLGSLGEQDITSSITRVKELSQQYQQFSVEKIIPTFEIITTVASAVPTENDDYSQELDPETIKPWIISTKEQGIYVVLDLQPGRASFADQVKKYEALLLEPHVGLALDPEWRLRTPQARHLKKVGSVTAEEINQTSEWLANLVKLNNLPQKIFMIHQFKLSMIENRETIKTDREELAYIIHMDGHGTLGQKIDSLNNILTGVPINVNLGWKNFIDEDKPTPTPEQTMSQIPQPVFVSYQ